MRDSEAVASFLKEDREKKLKLRFVKPLVTASADSG
jgi:hypothetical protein